MALVHLGLDLGSTGLRAAYTAPGEPGGFFELTGPEWPWLRCEPAAGAPLPVAFPSVKGGLGGPTPAGSEPGERPEAVLARALATVRRQVAAEAVTTVGHTAISVPSRFSARQRAALLRIAEGAELGTVSLVTDAVVALVGHVGPDGTGTGLIYGMGYGGFELALVRAVRGRFRVLGYEAAETPGGSSLDEQVLASWLVKLHECGARPGELDNGPVGWLRLRAFAERVKEELAAGRGPVLFPTVIRGSDRQLPLTMGFDQESFNLLARFCVAHTLQRADTLLQQSGLTRTDVESVLLVGGCTRMPQLRKLVSGLGGMVVPTGPEHLARGALAYAQRLTGRTTGWADDQPGSGLPSGGPGSDPALTLPALAGTLLAAPGWSGPDSPGRADDLDGGLGRARALLAAGRPAEAKTELRRLIGAAQALLDGIGAESSVGPQGGSAAPPVAQDPSTPKPSAAALLTQARERLGTGQQVEAIELSHRAWERDPSNPEVFNAMIDVHCTAAMAKPETGNFERDEHWLRCALVHDPTNPRVRGLLAERHFLHGKELQRSGRAGEARRVLEAALDWEPEHRAAQALLQRLSKRRS